MIRLILGSILMIAAFVALFVFIEGNPVVTQLMTAIHCKAGEKFVQIDGAFITNDFNRPLGREFIYACENDAGTQRDVTGPGIITLALAFIVPFLLGMIFLLSGSFGIIRGAQRRKIPAVSTGDNPGWFGDVQQAVPVTFSSGSKDPFVTRTSMVTVNGKQVNFGDLPADQAEQIKAAFGMMDQMLSQTTPTVITGSDSDLTDKLEELKEARDKGLISEDEYQHVRKSILDSLGK